MSISAIAPIGPIMPLENLSSGEGTQKSGTDFSKFLSDAMGQVDALQKNAEAASLQLATGEVEDLSSVMVAIEKANLSLSLTVATRDKVLDAYNQVMRMQI